MGGSVGKYRLMFTRIRDSGDRDHNRWLLLGLGANLMSCALTLVAAASSEFMSARLAHA
jgi:hypothetical protein